MSPVLGASEQTRLAFAIHDRSSLTAGVRAVLFDVDGTLYAQAPLRVLMAAELALEGLRAPQQTRRTARIISMFRRTREELRQEGDRSARPLEVLQFERTAERLRIDAIEIERIVDDWMMARPLKYLRRLRRPGVLGLLSLLAERGVQVGAFSDYPVLAKLRALGVSNYFSLGLCAADPPINAFKPHPKGFRHACEHWGVAPQEVLYVGDRPDTDGAGAAAAGIRCVLIGRGGSRGAARDGDPPSVFVFTDLTRAFVAG